MPEPDKRVISKLVVELVLQFEPGLGQIGISTRKRSKRYSLYQVEIQIKLVPG